MTIGMIICDPKLWPVNRRDYDPFLPAHFLSSLPMEGGLLERHMMITPNSEQLKSYQNSCLWALLLQPWYSTVFSHMLSTSGNGGQGSVCLHWCGRCSHTHFTSCAAAGGARQCQSHLKPGLTMNEPLFRLAVCLLPGMNTIFLTDWPLARISAR